MNLSNIEIENGLVGSVLSDNRALKEVGNIAPDDFTDSKLSFMWEAILEMDGAGIPIDIVTLGQFLRDIKAIDQVGGYTKLAKTLENTIWFRSAGYYAQMVRDLSVRRKSIALIEQAKKSISGGDMQTALSQFREIEIMDTYTENLFVPISERKKELAENFSRIMNNKGLSTGLQPLDKVLGLISFGELVTIGARPSIGKTTFALNIVLNNPNKKCLFFSLEMSFFDIATKLFSISNFHETRTFRDPDWLKDHIDEYLPKVENEIEKSNMFLLEKHSPEVDEVVSSARRFSDRYDYIIIDHLNLMMDKGGNSYESTKSITKKLRALSMKIQKPIFLLSQLKRGDETRQPSMQDLRDSGMTEADSNKVILLHRKRRVEEGEEFGNVLEFLIEKNREGEAGKVVYSHFELTTGRITNLKKETIEDYVNSKYTGGMR